MAATMQPQTVSIYGLIDPRTNQLRYVGKTKRSTSHRRYEHVCASHLKAKSHKNHWIESLLRDGERPESVVLEEVTESEWEEAESFWIQYMKFIGCNLVNSTSGGDGVHNPSAEIREKIGAASRGKKRTFSEEHRAKLAAANRLRAQNPEWCAAISRRMRGNKNGATPRSAQTCARISVAQRLRFGHMSKAERVAFSLRGVEARLKAMKRDIFCSVCGADVVARAWNTIYCSGACKTIAWRQRQKEAA